jgi:protein-tyrosine phosphatase
MKILMVCLGNICRSPLAEGILKHKIKLAGINWQVDSAGTGSWHSGELPDRRSIAIAQKYGIDITTQRARKVRSTDFEEFDLIFAMDTSNYNDLLKWTLDSNEKDKIKLIMQEAYPNESRSVPDPYYNDNGFEEVFAMLELACDNIIEHYA